MLTAAAEDGTEARAYDEGRGRVILILHPGMDDGSTWHRVADLLTPRFRVVIPHRRQYRLDLPAGASMADEVGHVRALVSAIREPVLVVGHSSGAVVALEALVDDPAPFVGAVLYDPPIVTDPLPLGIETTETAPGTVDRARAEVAAGRPGRAFTIFAREILRLPRVVVGLSAVMLPFLRRVRAFIPAQVEDAAAIEALGNQLDHYAQIDIPTILLAGERGQGDLPQRTAALADAMPNARTVTLPKQSHSAHLKAADAVAHVIEELADSVFAPPLDQNGNHDASSAG